MSLLSKEPNLSPSLFDVDEDRVGEVCEADVPTVDLVLWEVIGVQGTVSKSVHNIVSCHHHIVCSHVLEEGVLSVGAEEASPQCRPCR